LNLRESNALQHLKDKLEEACENLMDSLESFIDSEADEHAQAVRDDISECTAVMNKLRRAVPR
jgi:hypothetical protein